MAKIVFRNGANGTVNDSANVDGINARTDSVNGSAASNGREDTEQPNNVVVGSTDDNNPVSARVAGNDTSTNHVFNPNDYEYVNPISATGGTPDGTGTRRRRRSDAGTRRGTRKRNDTQTTQDLKTLLLTVHFGLAGLFKTDKLKLSEQEAETLGNAIKRVSDLYDVHILPEKQMAWLNLTIVAGCIYVPRFKSDKKPVQRESSRVVQMPVTNGGSGDVNKVM